MCWAVLVMTLCMGVPVGSAREVPGSNLLVGILYGAMGRGSKDVAVRVGGVGMFAYPSDLEGPEAVAARAWRVNFRRGVDALRGAGGDSIGDPRTYPGALLEARHRLRNRLPEALSELRNRTTEPNDESGQPCASTSP